MFPCPGTMWPCRTALLQGHTSRLHSAEIDIPCSVHTSSVSSSTRDRLSMAVSLAACCFLVGVNS